MDPTCCYQQLCVTARRARPAKPRNPNYLRSRTWICGIRACSTRNRLRVTVSEYDASAPAAAYEGKRRRARAGGRCSKRRPSRLNAGAKFAPVRPSVAVPALPSTPPPPLRVVGRHAAASFVFQSLSARRTIFSGFSQSGVVFSFAVIVYDALLQLSPMSALASAFAETDGAAGDPPKAVP